MIGEFNFFGMCFPWLLLTSFLALLTSRGVSTLLARKGFYRHVWHPPLFDLALFFIVLGLFVILFSVVRF